MIPLWTHGMCECLDCGWQWVGIWQLGCDDDLECKQCGSTDTVRDQVELA